jgi:hypothetical protein
LARGDALGVREVLDTEAIWRAREVQSLARLAQASLLVEAEGEVGRFHKTLALAAFLDAHEVEHEFLRVELPLSGRAWPTARIDDVARRAREWLEGNTAGSWAEAKAGGAWCGLEGGGAHGDLARR